MNPWAGIALVLFALGLLVVGVKLAQARGRLGAEGSRKAVHVGMGMVCLSFPWLFREIWPVWVLAGLACGALASLRIFPLMKRQLGGVLHGVDRVSWGEMYFPLGVAAVFTLAAGQTLTYVVPIALLTFADAAGALVGKRWGRRRFETLEGTKTIEGSSAVAGAGFLCIIVPLGAGGVEIGSAVLIGALMGLFCALVEAISWRGLDNVFLPLVAYTQISIYLGLPDRLLLVRLVVLAAIAALAWTWRRGRIVDDSARLGAALALYFFWAIGGWTWLVAPLILLVSYVWLMPSVPGGVPRHNLVAIICISSAGLIWCVAHAFAPEKHWLWPFTLGMATQQAVITAVRFSQARPQWGRMGWWAMGVAQAIVLQLAAYLLVDREPRPRGTDHLLGALAVACAVALFVFWEKHLQEPVSLAARWWKQGIVALAASTAGLALIYS